MRSVVRLMPRVGAALVAVALGFTGLVAGQPASGRTPPVPVPVLQWRSCGEDFPLAECAVATVPLDYDRPSRGTTELALARIPASDPADRVGTVFVNPGGPGGSGVGLVLFGFGEFLRDQLDGRFDVVGFDPRGVGASDPLHCFDSEEQLDEFFAGQPLFPFRRDQYRPFFDTYRALGAECLDDRQAVAANMSTADVARDMDLLRRAVGDPKLTYLGFSYGSYLGNTYANLFPRNIRALAIDGVLDPRLWSSGWQIVSDRVATQEVMDEFLRLCDEAGADCAFTAPGGAQARWRALTRAVRAEPVPLPDGTLVTYDLLIGLMQGALYEPASWGGPEGAAALLDLVADAALGDQAAAADVVTVRQSLIDQLTPSAPEADYDNGLDAYFGNQCADTEYPSSFGAFRLIDLYAAAGSPFGPSWWWFNAGCAGWPTSRDRYVGPWTARTSAPVLVIGNFFDPATAHTGAEATDRLLPNSRLLSYAGWGHTAYGLSACATQHTNAYLLTGSLPPAGTVCPANPNPFVPSALRAAAGPARLVGLPPPGWLVQVGEAASAPR
jgi:pimeloyl-ACP methyl ester carboxylesterase